MSGRLRWRGSRTESVDDYTGVLIPLDQAHLHSHSARCGRMEYEEILDDDDEEDDFSKHQAGNEQEETGMLEMNAAEYSIEGLRREVRKGGGRMRSVYESQPVSIPYSCLALRCRASLLFGVGVEAGCAY